MIKLKISYSNDNEKEKLMKELKDKFGILKVSKEYRSSGQYKRIYVSISDN